MTDQPRPTAEERVAQRRAREDALREQLAALELDGPFDFPRGGGFDPLAMFGGGARDRFAVCLRCGSIVVLNDPEEADGGRQFERGVRLHTAWHQEMAQ